jgi:hypothetical protein
MNKLFALVLSVAINAAFLGSLQYVSTSDVPKGEVYITALGNSAVSLQYAALNANESLGQ